MTKETKAEVVEKGKPEGSGAEIVVHKTGQVLTGIEAFAALNFAALDKATAAKLAELGEQTSGMEPAGAPTIKTKGAHFNVGGQALGTELDCIVLGTVIVNAKFAGKFSPDNPKPPVCWSVGTDAKAMKPMGVESLRESKACDTCPLNQFGSDEAGGRGKVCRNLRRLAVIPLMGEPTPGEIAGAEILLLSVPPTSLKSWGWYVRALEGKHAAPQAVVTAVKIVEDERIKQGFVFLPRSVLSVECIKAVLARMQDATKVLALPFPEPREDAPKEKKGKAARK